MRKVISKTILKLALTFVVIFSVCEVTSFRSQDFQQAKPVEAATSEEEGQYIPPNLDYSQMIKDIKAEEGVVDDDTDIDNNATQSVAKNEESFNVNDFTTSGVEPQDYMNVAGEYVKEAMSEQEEFMRRHKVQKAFFFYKKYLEKHQGNLDALLGAGTMAIYLGKEQDAKNFLMEAYATYPKNPHVHKALGDYSFRFSNYNNAIEYYNLSLSSGNLKDYATNIATAVCYEKLGDIEKAIQYYKVAQHLNPDSEIANKRLEMYAAMEADGYQADTRKYEDATKIKESEDIELNDIILDSRKIK